MQTHRTQSVDEKDQEDWADEKTRAGTRLRPIVGWEKAYWRNVLESQKKGKTQEQGAREMRNSDKKPRQ